MKCRVCRQPTGSPVLKWCSRSCLYRDRRYRPRDRSRDADYDLYASLTKYTEKITKEGFGK